MLARATKLFLILALTFSLGVHWIFIQSVAWVGMVVSYSQTAPLREALSKTFDGLHPCKLCKVVQTGQQAETKQAPKKITVKLDFWLGLTERLLYPPEPPSPAPFQTSPLPLRLQPPPTPPPRLG